MYLIMYILTATGSTAEINEPKSKPFKMGKSSPQIPDTPVNDKPINIII